MPDANAEAASKPCIDDSLPALKECSIAESALATKKKRKSKKKASDKKATGAAESDRAADALAQADNDVDDDDGDDDVTADPSRVCLYLLIQ